MCHRFVAAGVARLTNSGDKHGAPDMNGRIENGEESNHPIGASIMAALTRACGGILALLTLMSCVANLASKVDLSDTNFILGKTTRQEVVDLLGLPRERAVDEAGNERLFYAGGADLTGFVVAGPGGTVGPARPGALDLAMSKWINGGGAVYSFDVNGVLVGEDSPRTQPEGGK